MNTQPKMQRRELLAYLCDGASSSLCADLEAWLNDSRRFAAFAELHRDKVRKKLRVTADAEGALDLRHELETAYLLSRVREFTVTYEPYAATRPYGPDFAVRYTTSFTFNVEATRLRRLAGSPGATAIHGERIIDTLCHKLFQLPASAINVVVIGLEDGPLGDESLGIAMAALKKRVETRDAVFFARHHFRDASDFFRRFERLSGAVVRQLGDARADGASSYVLWLNPQARHPLPQRAVTLLRASFGRSG
jgi:hypothetical protein